MKMIKNDTFQTGCATKRIVQKQHGYVQLIIFFHPDFHRRLWYHTRSAIFSTGSEVSVLYEKTLAGSSIQLSIKLPPVGNYTPP